MARLMLECQLKDYFPDKLTVQWLEGDKSVEGHYNKSFRILIKARKTTLT